MNEIPSVSIEHLKVKNLVQVENICVTVATRILVIIDIVKVSIITEPMVLIVKVIHRTNRDYVKEMEICVIEDLVIVVMVLLIDIVVVWWVLNIYIVQHGFSNKDVDLNPINNVNLIGDLGDIVMDIRLITEIAITVISVIMNEIKTMDILMDILRERIQVIRQT